MIYTIDFDNIINIKPEEFIKKYDFQIDFDGYSKFLCGHVSFFGIKCYGRFCFVDDVLKFCTLMPEIETNELLNYPNPNYEAECRNVIVPIINKEFGEKVKDPEYIANEFESLFRDGYCWETDYFRIRIDKTVDNGRDSHQGGHITFSRKSTKEKAIHLFEEQRHITSEERDAYEEMLLKYAQKTNINIFK